MATSHRYVPIMHALKVLEYNRNKEIYYFLKSDVFEKSDFSIILKKYPNFHFVEYMPKNITSNDGQLNHSYTLEYSKNIQQIISNNLLTKNKKKFSLLVKYQLWIV